MKNLKIVILCCVAIFFFSNCQENAKKEAITKRPNILFAISDDQSFPHAGAYGCQWVKTPAFDRIAKEGLLFNQAFTPNAKCSPSRACILTGRNSWQLEAATNHVPFFPEKFKTFPEALQEAGYFVGRTGKGWAPGIAQKDGKKRELIGKNYTAHQLNPPAKFISTNNYAENFKSFLAENEKNQPFFFWYGAIEPHRRYEYQVGIKKGGKKLSDIDQVPPFWPDNDTVRTDILDYAYEIEHFDQHLAEMVQTLEQQGLLENTIIIVTSDNGMPFPRVKGQIYEYDNHLPLAIRWGKGIKNPGRIIDEYVNFIDFAPTFLEAAGISSLQSGMEAISGESLFSIFKNKKTASGKENHPYVLIGKERHDVGRPNDEGYPVRGIIQNNFAYTINFKPNRWPAGNPETGYLNTDGSPTKTVILNAGRADRNSHYWKLNFGKRAAEELYDLEKDPFCLNNLANLSEFNVVRSELKSLLYAALKKDADPRILGNDTIFDQYQYAHPRSINFYNRFMNGEKIKAGWVNPSDFEKNKMNFPIEKLE
jgi:arylsulfatase A-like enzyme